MKPQPGVRKSRAYMVDSYNTVLYKSGPIGVAHISRLAVISRMFGLDSADPASCRVLELGCGDGSHLIPMAREYPNSQFLGVDLAERPVARGVARAEDLWLNNVQLQVADVTKLGDLGQFDYIIAHGLFSWVPKPVQPGIVETCGRLLAPKGVAYISYNTYPAWHMREATRRIVLQHVSGCKSPEELQRRAVALCETISRTREDTPIWRDFMKAEAERLMKKAAVDCFHDDFDEFNNPIYFRDFIRIAEASGLKYLAESDLMDSAHPSGLPPEAQTEMDNCGIVDRIEREQFLDLLMTRMFRRTMLCRAETAFDHSFHAETLRRFHFSSSMRPPALTPESIRSDERQRFEWQGVGANVSDPFVKATFFELARTWPGTITFDELLARVVNWAPAQMDPENTLIQILVHLPLGHGIDIRPNPWPWAQAVSDRPVVSRLARMQIQNGVEVSSLRHNEIRLDNPMAVQLVKLLDGTHARADLPALLSAEPPVIDAALERLRHFGLLES